MNRIVMITLGWLILVSIAHAGPDTSHNESDQLKHDWKEDRRNGEIMLVSNYPAPAPFSMSGEPEATLGMNSAIVSPGRDTLKKVVDGEVSEIRKDVQIAEYEEEDGKKPIDGIATYYENIDGIRVAFIKYRGMGVIGKSPGLPRTAIHSIFIMEGRIFLTHLIVCYAGHQDEVRQDQLRIIRSIISAAPGNAKQKQ